VLFGGKIKARKRTLMPEELKAFWSGTEKLDRPYGALFRLLALTGARLNELARARWSELDPTLRRVLRDARTGAAINWGVVSDENKVLRVPAERYKSDRVFVMQLTGDALTIIEQLRRSGSGEFLFSSTGRGPINGLSAAKKRLDALMLQYLRDEATARDEDPAKVELPPWKTHDLRRTLRTNLSALKVPVVVAECALGHTISGLQAVYDTYDYQPEIREALERWAAKLHSIVWPQPPAPTTVDNVVNLPRQRKRAS
jgi:integrase